MVKYIPLLIIGAGPFGLVMSAYARRYDIDHIIIGKTMDFWQANMPKRMYLRSIFGFGRKGD
jgi:cation diffusion facilitator CzcD-associated flavoprotein CzcO